LFLAFEVYKQSRATPLSSCYCNPSTLERLLQLFFLEYILILFKKSAHFQTFSKHFVPASLYNSIICSQIEIKAIGAQSTPRHFLKLQTTTTLQTEREDGHNACSWLVFLLFSY